MVATWRDRLRAAAVRILDAVIDAYPGEVNWQEFAERTGLTASGATFVAAVGFLRRYAPAESNGWGWRAKF
jgi:hypothetical protein